MTHTLSSVRHFAHEHDDLPAFHAAYFVLTLLAAAIFSLGAFGLLILLHMLLDWVKYRDLHQYTLRKTLEGMVRESLLDVTLFLVGISVTVYLDQSIPLIAGLQGMARVQAGLFRTALQILPKIKILHHTLNILSHMQRYFGRVHPRMGHAWTAMEYWCFFFIGFSLLLVLVSPLLLQIESAQLFQILQREMVPHM